MTMCTEGCRDAESFMITRVRLPVGAGVRRDRQAGGRRTCLAAHDR
jgi:hypothetical protein